MIIVIVAVAEGLTSASTPRSNIRFRDGSYSVVAIAPGDILDKAGVRPGDEIVGLDGADLTNTFDFWDRLGSAEIGAEVRFNVLRNGEALELPATTWRLARPVDAVRVLVPVIVLMVLGAGVFVVRPTLRATFLLLLYCMAAAINDVVQIAPVVGTGWPQRLLTVAYTMGSLPASAILLHLFLVFPHRGRFQRLATPGLILAYIIQLGLALDYLLPALIPATASLLSSPSLTRPLIQLYSASVTGCYLLAFAGLVSVILGHDDLRVRNQAKVLAAGFALLLGLQVVLVEIPLRISHRTLVDPYTMCLVDLVVPVFVAIAIVRQRLFGIDVLIRHGLVYGAASTVVAVVFVVAMGTIGWLADTLSFSAPTAMIAVAAAVAAILFHPARKRAQELVDRWIYKRRYSYRRLLTEISSRLGGFVELPAALEYLARRIDDTLQPEWIVFEVAGGGSEADRLFDGRGRPVGSHPVPDASLTAPMTRGSERVGAVMLGPRPAGVPYLPEDRDFVTTVANLAASVVASARLVDERSTRERLALLGTASAQLVHELKNPLGAMHSTLAVLRRRFAEDPKGRELTDIVGNEVERLNDRVLDVLSFVRPQPRGGDEIDISELLARLLPVVEAEFRSVNVGVALEVGSDGAMVRGNPDRLRQIFLNLLLNSREAMPTGGDITVRVESDAVSDSRNPSVTITISDTGPGFNPDSLEHAFDAFFTTKTLGTGLGLANVRQIVEEHGGTVSAGNREAGGAEIVVRFPVLDLETDAESTLYQENR
jgi:signal transduction histidine kinase